MRKRLQAEIEGEDARLRTVADVLSKPPAKAHGARLPAAVAVTADPTTARDFKTPTAKPKPAAAHAAKVQQSLARIAAKRRAHLKHLLGFATHGGKRGGASTVAAQPVQRQVVVTHIAPASRAHKALAAVKRKPRGLGAAAFDIHTVRRFDPGQSLSFARELFATFALSYADTSLLTGYVGRDIVQLGHYYAMTRFGCALDCNDAHFNGVDGILGFGLPKPGREGRQLPRPILWAMTDDRENRQDSNTQELHRKFSFFSTDTAAELQLGGYDPDTCDDTMYYTPSLSKTDFIVGVTSVRFGHDSDTAQELLQFTNPTGGEYLPAIMDSGTSCLVIPGDRLDGRLQNNPFNDFSSLWAVDKSFYVTIGGQQFKVPYSSWFLERTNQTCVQPSPAGMQGLLIGDVFFRSYMVEFDMSDKLRPTIGIARLNLRYSPVQGSELDYYHEHRAPIQKLRLLQPRIRWNPLRATRSRAKGLPGPRR